MIVGSANAEAATAEVLPRKLRRCKEVLLRGHYDFLSFGVWESLQSLAAVETKLRLEFIDLFRCDANRAVYGNIGAREQRGEQIALIALDVGQESAGLDGTASLARDDEWQVLSSVTVAVFEPRSPHHDAVVEQCPITFAQAVHLLDHVGKLFDVELGDGSYFSYLILLVVVVSG